MTSHDSARVVIHLIDEDGRVPCEGKRFEEINPHCEASRWPEYVDCLRQCKVTAHNLLVRADMQRHAWAGPRTVETALGPIQLTADTAGALRGEPLVRITIPPTVSGREITEAEARSLEIGLAEALLLGELLRGRVRHWSQYAVDGAPEDPAECTHHGARVKDGTAYCWTCGIIAPL